jgi:hypothetical protein
MTSVGVVGKWLAAPILVAALGYFVVAPLARNRGADLMLPKPSETPAHSGGNPEITIDNATETPARGPDVAFTLAAKEPERPRRKKPRHKPPETKPVEKKAEAPAAPKVEPTTEPPVDQGGSGGAATGGDTGAPVDSGSTGGTTGGAAGGSTGDTGATTAGNAPTTRAPGRSADT